MNSFLKNIEFEKEITIKEPKPVKAGKGSKRAARIKRRLLQLFFFIVCLIALWVAVKGGLMHTVSFIKGHEYQSWEEIKTDYDNRYK